MNEKKICPLCGGPAKGGKCLSCGYIIPDDIDLEYNTLLNNLDPEDYPMGEVTKNAMENGSPKRKKDLMPDVNDVLSEPAAANNYKAEVPKLVVGSQTAPSVYNTQNAAPPAPADLTKKEAIALAVTGILTLVPIIPMWLLLIIAFFLIIFEKNGKGLFGLIIAAAVILRSIAGLLLM